MNRKIIYGLATITVLVLGFLVLFREPGFIDLPQVEESQINTNTWITYQNDDFNFRIMHPIDWVVYEAPDSPIAPTFNIYPKSYQGYLANRDLPLIHHSATPNVSIFPEGVPTEGVFGDTVLSDITFKEPPMRAFDFVLENGDRWATFAGYQFGPKSWGEFGFIWAKADIESYSLVCLRDGKERPVESCDFLGSTDRIIHRGQIDKRMRAIEVEILKTFEFIN